MFDRANLEKVVDRVYTSLKTTLHIQSDSSAESPDADTLRANLKKMVTEALDQYNISVARGYVPPVIYLHKQVGDQMLLLDYFPATSQLRIHHIQGEFFEYITQINPFSAQADAAPVEEEKSDSPEDYGSSMPTIPGSN